MYFAGEELGDVWVDYRESLLLPEALFSWNCGSGGMPVLLFSITDTFSTLQMWSNDVNSMGDVGHW